MTSSEIKIRQEQNADVTTVFDVVTQAFQQTYEALLVDRLRSGAAFIPELSLVATLNNRIVGHILFTELLIQSGEQTISGALAMAPVAVIPGYQKMGVGSLLIRKGLEIAAGMGYKAVVVLGHAGYYPKFGFEPAAKWNIHAPFEVPSINFMALELIPGALERMSGTVIYAPEFGIGGEDH